MNKFVIPVILVVMAAIAIALLKYGAGPQPISIMSASSFDRPEQIGAVIFKRFYDPLSRSSVAVFGAPPAPEFHARIAEGFLAAAAQEGKRYDVVLFEPALEPLQNIAGATLEPLEFNRVDGAEAASKIKSFDAQGKRVFVYTASTFSSHALAGNAIHALEKAYGEPLFSLTSGTLVLRATHEFLIDPPCVGLERDVNGTANLGCLMLTASRHTYRKMLPLEKWTSIVDQEAPADFLLLTSSPELAARAEKQGAPATPPQ